MIDKTVKFIDVFMLHDDLSSVAIQPLPPKYSFRMFDGSESDVKKWIKIIVSSGDCETAAEAQEGFETYYRPHFETLSERCVFLLDENKQPIGTATAFFVVDPQPGLPEICDTPLPIPEHATGHLHWVAIKEPYKGKGLAKPMISYTLQLMHRLGHQQAFLHSQTPSWLACKIYLDLGWQPFRFVQSQENFDQAWQIITNKIDQLS